MKRKPKPKPQVPEPLVTAVQQFSETNDSDLFLYSGDIAEPGAHGFIHGVIDKPATRQRATFFLTTFGGDPHCAFRMMRALQRRYDEIRLLVVGPCKSAGTLMAVGADELVYGPFGELGPIDVQMFKRDEIVLTSGLDTIQGIESLIHQLFTGFEKYMLDIMGKSGGAISTRTASEIAGQLVTGLFQPIAAQIDPHRIGEVERAMNIALAYGERLRRKNLTFEALAQLVHGYPSHGFVIDAQEATRLFDNVRELSESEYNLLPLLGEFVATPQEDVVMLDLGKLTEEASHEPEREGAAPGHSQPDDRVAEEELPGESDRGDGTPAAGAAQATKPGLSSRDDPQAAEGSPESGGSPREPTVQ